MKDSVRVQPIVVINALFQARSCIYQSFSYLLCYLVGVAVAYSVEYLSVEYAVELPVVDLVVSVFFHVEESDV